MAWSEQKIQQYWKRGRGAGEGAQYVPWLMPEDLPAKQRWTATPHNWKHNRTSYLVSELDLAYFYVLQWSDDVIDMRESYPLPRERTMALAQERHLSHPKITGTQIPLVMTTSFLVTHKEGLQALSVVETRHVTDKVRQQLEIIQSYWAEQRVPWMLITEDQVPWTLARNVQTLHRHRLAASEIDQGIAKLLLDELQNLDDWDRRTFNIIAFTQHVGAKQGLVPAKIMEHLLFLMANERVVFDIYNVSLDLGRTRMNQLTAVDGEFTVKTIMTPPRIFPHYVLVNAHE